MNSTEHNRMQNITITFFVQPSLFSPSSWRAFRDASAWLNTNRHEPPSGAFAPLAGRLSREHKKVGVSPVRLMGRPYAIRPTFFMLSYLAYLRDPDGNNIRAPHRSAK